MKGKVELRVPGRIEVLGKHVDYAGGRSLLCATERAFRFAVTPTSTGRFRLRDAASGQQLVLDPATLGSQADVGSAAWGVYPRAALWRVVSDFGSDAVPGCDVEFTSDIPSSSGLSSSSAFVTGLVLALDAAGGFLDSSRGRRGIPDLPAFAEYLGAVESGRPYGGFSDSHGGGVGVRGGAQDHTAILCSRSGSLVQASFGPVRIEGACPLPPDHCFVIGVSGVQASKAGAVRDRYNALSDRGRRVADVWRRERGVGPADAPHLGAIVRRMRDDGASPEQAVDELAVALRRSGDPEAELLAVRAEQFVIETEVLVPGVEAALQAQDLDAVGDCVDRSQRLAESVLENQVPATRSLAASARELGAVAASAFGAGFGGAVWSLVHDSDAAAYTEAWRSRYLSDFPEHARRSAFLSTRAEGPAGPLPERFRS